MTSKLLEQAAQSIVDLDEKKAKEVVKMSLDENIDPFTILSDGFAVGLKKLGDSFERGRVFLPELILGSDIMKTASETLGSYFPQSGLGQKKGRVVIGTVAGDIHDIGKGIVISHLKAYDFEVWDLGRDVPTERFIEKAVELDVHVIGTSALLVTTMPSQKELETQLKKNGLRDRFKTMVGGAPVTEHWAKRIGADGYAENAAEAVQEMNRLMEDIGTS